MKKLFSLICVCCLFLTASGQDPTLTATVSKNPVGNGEQFTITYTVNANGNNFVAPAMTDFNVLSGPNQSFSTQFINGQMSQTINLTYYLQAKSEGTFNLGPATIISGGKKIVSNPLTIKVVKGAPQAQAGSDYKEVTSDNLFIRSSVDKTSVYQGESLVATYKIYTKVNIVNYAIPRMPTFTGFWTQDMPMPGQIQLHNETVNGVTYSVGELRKVLLFPQQSGTLVIDPMEVECIARIPVKRNRQSNDPFDIFNDPFFNDPFFGSGARDVKAMIKSAPVKVTVKPLPDGAPASFNGAVGKFSFEATLDKKVTKTNEPVSLKIKISGKGNLKLINAPELNIPSDIETYDPKVGENVSATEGGTSGTKTFEYLLIPRHQGTYDIEPVSFSFFDLDKKQYVSFSSPKFELKVDKGNDETAVTSGASKADIQVLGNDIRFIRTGPLRINTSGNTFYLSPLFYLSLILPFLLFIGAIIYRQRMQALNSNQGLVKSRKANKMAKKRLAVAGKLLGEKDKVKIYDEIFRALWGYISDKLGIPPADLSKESAAAALKKKNISDDSVNTLISTLDYCEFARFAQSSGDVSPEKAYKDAIDIITRIEDEIK
jgi:hypothetical protein